MISHTAFFGDSVRAFTLTDTIIEELQQKTGLGIGALFLRMSSSQFRVADIVEVIRLGLVGGGTNPQEAQRLVDAYAKDRPFDETFPLALDILDARWNGKPERAIWTNGEPEAVDPAIWSNGNTDDDTFGFPQDEIQQAASTGDMTAAINESLKESAL